MFQYWKEVGSQAIQDITDRLARSYEKFFQERKLKRKVSPPRYKKREAYRSITLKQAGYNLLEGGKVIIGRKVYKYFNSREMKGKIKTLTIKRDLLGDLYLFFSVEEEKRQEQVIPDKIVGLDFGLKTFLTTSEEEKIKSPEFYKKNLKKVQKGHRKLSRKIKGSNNRNRERIKLCRLYKKIHNQRKDHHFKLAKALCQQYDLICFETLDLQKMKKRFGRKISDLGFHQFLQVLKHVCSKMGKGITFLDPYELTTKTCSKCLSINQQLTLKDRRWKCHQCAENHNRDINAAINIKRQGIALWNRKHKTCLQAAFV